MIELTELHCEQICGGYWGGLMAAPGRGRGRGPEGLAPIASGPITTTSTTTSLAGVFNVNPQINVAVNLALFNSSVTNTQGNGSALVVA